MGSSDQNHPKEKEMQEGKVVVWESFITAKERREVKGKVERDTYQLNVNFQRIERRDKKAFLSEHCK